jgi:hypothetical protein
MIQKAREDFWRGYELGLRGFHPTGSDLCRSGHSFGHFERVGWWVISAMDSIGMWEYAGVVDGYVGWQHATGVRIFYRSEELIESMKGKR